MNKRLVYFMFIFIGITFYFIPNVVKAETFDGEYSIEYLLKNYSIVTLNGNLNFIDYTNSNGNDASDLIEGSILINGNVTSDNPLGLSINSNDGSVKSFIKGTKGDNVNISSSVITESNYIDFEKLKNVVTHDSLYLADSSTNFINNKKPEVTKPGIYTINNTAEYEFDTNSQYTDTAVVNKLLIKNYDKNSIYVFNYYNDVITQGALPEVYLMETGSSNSISLREYIDSGEYTGNVIFNFPNAKYVYVCNDFRYGIHLEYNSGFSGTIVAPKATVKLNRNYYDYQTPCGYIYSTIIAKEVIYDYLYENRVIKNTKLKLNKKLDDSDHCEYLVEANDYDDDYYSRSYSLSDLLQNYSLVTLGHKQIDSKSKLLQFGNKPGSIRMFHITGQALISGDLYGEREFKTAFDLESNKVTESFVRGDVTYKVDIHKISRSVIQPWDNMDNDSKNYVYQKNNLFVGTVNPNLGLAGFGPGNYTGLVDNYINFDRLYNNVVAEQKGIEEGDKVKASNGVAHIPIGGNYVIDDVSDINKIVFDNFEENKDVITIVTIKNSGDINFPEINKDKGYYKGIVTNDYYGKTQATHLYERDTFVTEDGYYGNIIFNVPNATYIKLKENAPFAGHLIAPNADVETEETHFAGCFIVNSIYGAGNTEAHFYPLTAYDNCECSVGDQVPESLHARFNELRLSRLLGGEKSIVETNIVGDQAQYKKDTDQLNQIIDNCPMRKHYSSSLSEILKNPPTYGTIGAVLLIIIGLIIGLGIYKKKKAV